MIGFDSVINQELVLHLLSMLENKIAPSHLSLTFLLSKTSFLLFVTFCLGFPLESRELTPRSHCSQLRMF